MPSRRSGDDDVGTGWLGERDDGDWQFIATEVPGQFFSAAPTEWQDEAGLRAEELQPARNVDAFATSPAALFEDLILFLPPDMIDAPLDIDGWVERNDDR